MRVLLLAAAAMFAAPSLLAQGCGGLGELSSAFFEKHCFDCHDSTTSKGGVNLEKAHAAMNGRDQAELWTRVYDNVAKGEMPPAKKTRPAPEAKQRLLDSIRPVLLKADRAHREVVQRRLNRSEYENTMRDLLAIDIDLQHLLPEDQQVGGFDNNGEALALSTEQLEGYISGAAAAVDAAIVTSPRPKTETFTVDSLHEVQRYIDSGEYGYVDGRIVTYTAGNTTYSKISTRAKKTPVRGRYRFKFQAAAHNTDEVQFFMVSVPDPSGVGAPTPYYFEVGPEPETFEIEALMGGKSAVQFFPLGLPSYVKNKEGARGVGFGAVEVTGPLIEQWPPRSHSELIGDVDLETGTAADAERILRRFMPRAFRRPAKDAEVARYLGLVTQALDAKRSFRESLRMGLIGVLCSPHFIFLHEGARPDTRRVSDTELASRLSYFLWSTMPDEELSALAAKGTLSKPDVLKAQVERMLKSGKLDTFVSNFTGQWLRLRSINDTTPDRRLYGKYDDLLEMSVLRESREFFRRILLEDLPVSDFLDSDWTMLNQRLAAHYDIPGVSGLAMRPVKLPPDSVRGGVLTQAAVLKVTANGTTTSPVLRGVWVLENILGNATLPPPPNTGGIEPDIRGATTIREQLEMHRHAESCASCHRKIDPPGFALESFDPIGDYRESYLRWHVSNEEKGWGRVGAGAPVDATGVFPTGEPFAGIRDFKKLLMTQKRDFARCFTGKLLTYALGREMGFSDRPAIDAIIRKAEAAGGGMRSLIHAMIQSEIFATR